MDRIAIADDILDILSEEDAKLPKNRERALYIADYIISREIAINEIADKILAEIPRYEDYINECAEGKCEMAEFGNNAVKHAAEAQRELARFKKNLSEITAEWLGNEAGYYLSSLPVNWEDFADAINKKIKG